MKRILVFLSLLAINFVINEILAQNFEFTLTVIDSNQKEDSIVIGYKENATIGVDENLGEVNLFENVCSDLDIRSIQRNTTTQNILWLNGCGLNPTEYFQQNIDLKKDFRQYLSCGNHFIVQIVSSHYPVTLKLGRYSFDQDVPYTSYYSNGNCGPVYGKLGLNDTIAVFSNSSDNLLIGFHPQIIDACSTGIISDGVSSNNQFPTFVDDKLHITNNENMGQIFTIYNSVGKMIWRGVTVGKETVIDVSTYVKGIYFVRFSKKYLSRKFIKK